MRSANEPPQQTEEHHEEISEFSLARRRHARRGGACETRGI
jgi:hypothetical protein